MFSERNLKCSVKSACPYCHSARSLLLGQVYCSREAGDMEQLETGTLFIRSKKLDESATHISRLSIRLMLNGSQHYRVGSREFKVHPANYLIVNQGQSYRTSFHDDHELEMILVAFQPEFARDLLYNLVSPEEQLLDNPEVAASLPFCFGERTYDMDVRIHALFTRLRVMLSNQTSHSGSHMRGIMDHDEIYREILLRMYELHGNQQRKAGGLEGLRLATRDELYRRVGIARDYLDAHPHEAVSLAQVARIACLSPHHFKRTFKKVYGETPHGFHFRKRMTAARGYLGNLPVTEVAARAGFQDTSAFIRAFKKHFGYTPGKYRHPGPEGNQDALVSCR